jgi:hypothetical protein
MCYKIWTLQSRPKFVFVERVMKFESLTVWWLPESVSMSVAIKSRYSCTLLDTEIIT